MSDLEFYVVWIPIFGASFLNIVRAGAGNPDATPVPSVPPSIKFDATKSFYGPSETPSTSIPPSIKFDATKSFHGPSETPSTSSRPSLKYTASKSSANPQYESEFKPGTSSALEGRVLLSMAARKLQCRDLTSKSDPMCVVHEYNKDSRQWIKRGQTETWQDVHNPDFVAKVEVVHLFEEEKYLLFHVYDIDSDSSNLNDHDFLGYVKVNLSKLVRDGRVELQLNTNKRDLYSAVDEKELSKKIRNQKLNTLQPYIIIWTESLTNSRLLNEDRVFLQLSGTRISQRNFFGWRKSNPYILIYKARPDAPGDWIPVHSLQAVKATRKPTWKKFSLLFTALANADPDHQIKFTCKNEHSMKEHEIIGEAITTIRELDTTTRRTFPLIDPKRIAKHPTRSLEDIKSSGFLHIEHFTWWKTYPFLSYLSGGLNINCIVAIDFTASNKDPSHEDSLHRINPKDPTYMNPYEHTITAIVSILENYNKSKKFLVLGFGAQLPRPAPEKASHMFYVNLNQDPTDPYNDPHFIGVDGVLDGYRECLTKIMLSYPTYFEPVIKHVVDIAREYQNGDEYFILLILTDDGVIQDMDETIRIIIEGSTLPLSIIIIGIGKADFRLMEELDSDNELLWIDDKVAERDIVQFVHFDKFFQKRNDPNSRNRLAKEVLREVPKQLITYMASRNFEPKPPIYEPHDLPADPDQMSE